MQRFYTNDENIISEGDGNYKGQLATLDDIMFSIQSGTDIQLNQVYLVQEGAVIFHFDEDTLDFNYLLVKL